MDDVGGDALIAPHEQVFFPRADEGIGPYGIVPTSLPYSRLFSFFPLPPRFIHRASRFCIKWNSRMLQACGHGRLSSC